MRPRAGCETDPMHPRLHDRIALVTGASRGIGRAIARRFAAEGARLVLVARDAGALRALADNLERTSPHGEAAQVAPLDLEAPAGVPALAELVERRYGRLDILVGNAGIAGDPGPVTRLEPEAFGRALAVNATANLVLLRSFDGLLRRSAAGRAIFVTTGLSRRPMARLAGYAASKAALEALVLAYAEEVADTPLRVNLLDPGQVRTELHRRAVPEADPSALKRPEDIAEAFLALAEAGCRRHGEILKASAVAEWCDWCPASR